MAKTTLEIRKNPRLKAVLSQYYMLQNMYGNHPATAAEVESRNWLDKMEVLVDHIKILEEALRAQQDSK